MRRMAVLEECLRWTRSSFDLVDLPGKHASVGTDVIFGVTLSRPSCRFLSEGRPA